MNYRLQASILGASLIFGGVTILIFAVGGSQNAASPVEGSVIAFVGLGLILTGVLTTFAAPQSLVVSEIVSRAISPPAENLTLILNSLLPKRSAVHVSQATLGSESQVLLVLSEHAKSLATHYSGRDTALRWDSEEKILEPLGIDLMEGYEKVLKRDFLGLDVPQLSRLLSKAIVPELQLASGFSIMESASGRVEASWIRPTVAHTCLSEESTPHPELCCLCSSVACALAKATGESVRIDESRSGANPLSVTTTYTILEGRG